MNWKENAARVRAAALEASPGTQGWFHCECPFCPDRSGKSGGKKLFVRPSGIYKCFRCDARGRVRGGLETELGEADSDHIVTDEEVADLNLPEGFIALGEGEGLSARSLRPAREYLESRGFGDPKMWRQTKMGVVQDGFFGGRIVIPIMNGAEWCGWVARDYTGQAAHKYKYPRGMKRGQTFYEGPIILESTQEPALVVEGVFDALPYLGQALAVLGKPTEQHLQMIAHHTQRPIACCLDGDAWEEAQMMALRLRLMGVFAGFVRLPPLTDPCSVAREHGASWLLDQARRCIEAPVMDKNGQPYVAPESAHEEW